MNRYLPAVVVLGAIFAVPAAADTINVPTDAGSIQAAIDMAEDGDEILVAAGTWVGSASLCWIPASPAGFAWPR